MSSKVVYQIGEITKIDQSTRVVNLRTQSPCFLQKRLNLFQQGKKPG